MSIGTGADHAADCRVYWGSHGCCLPRGHDGPHLCDCAFGEDGRQDPRGNAALDAS